MLLTHIEDSGETETWAFEEWKFDVDTAEWGVLCLVCRRVDLSTFLNSTDCPSVRLRLLHALNGAQYFAELLVQLTNDELIDGIDGEGIRRSTGPFSGPADFANRLPEVSELELHGKECDPTCVARTGRICANLHVPNGVWLGALAPPAQREAERTDGARVDLQCRADEQSSAERGARVAATRGAICAAGALRCYGLRGGQRQVQCLADGLRRRRRRAQRGTHIEQRNRHVAQARAALAARIGHAVHARRAR